MMIQERLKRSNLIILVVPVAVAGVLLAVGLGVLVLLLETIYLPRLGLTMQDPAYLGRSRPRPPLPTSSTLWCCTAW